MKRLASILMICLFVNTYAQQTTDHKKMDETKKVSMKDKTMKDKQSNPNMSDKTSVVGVASTTTDFKTLTKAIKGADLVATLNGEGPFTVFAPTDAAFNKIPQEKLKGLMNPASKSDLKTILTYHVLPGKITAEELIASINDNGGQYIATTVEGTELTFSLQGETVVLTDANGGTATVITADVDASNGIIHGIDTVIMPTMTKM
ncbi:Uncaracterized surface protein containing fasciclin (FAS1) repeats [Flavobacteriaceae bacterium MAR_2010_188]|nr:Uncaracterized surface protein containing fasciclin (FAS1) repeats [Flavobacteriaceae bacterium MAR_2010_188]